MPSPDFEQMEAPGRNKYVKRANSPPFFLPCPAHIAKECARIRAGWSESERIYRLSGVCTKDQHAIGRVETAVVQSDHRTRAAEFELLAG